MGRLMNTVHWKRYLDWTRNNRIKRFVESRGNHVFGKYHKTLESHSNNKESFSKLWLYMNAPSAI